MASIKLTGDTSGEITISAPAVAGTNTLTLPANTGTIVTSESGVGDLPSTIAGPAFSAYPTGNQSMTSSTWTKLEMGNEEFDTTSDFDTTLYRFTPSVAGYYQITAGLRTATAVAIAFALYKNGTLIKRFPSFHNTASVNENIGGSVLVEANGTTDYFELYAYAASSWTISSGSSSVFTYFNGYLARAA